MPLVLQIHTYLVHQNVCKLSNVVIREKVTNVPPQQLLQVQTVERGKGHVRGHREVVRRGKEKASRLGEIRCFAAAFRPGLLRGVRHAQHLLRRIQGSYLEFNMTRRLTD